MAFGSGTLIDAREQYGLVITNWHVVRDATGKIEVRFPGSEDNPSGFTSEARPLKLDETWDLAALVIWRPPTNAVTLAQRSPAKGETLTICGYGGGDYLSQTGRCTDYYSPEVGQPQELVELNVEARQGDSGGPIFNSRGELAGVLFGAARGTTLGSFGPRVQTFLASLAPNIGEREGALYAAAPQSRRQKPTDDQLGRAREPVDPFLAAERSNPSLFETPDQSRSALAQTSEPAPQEITSLPPSLADRSHAPRLAAQRASGRHWQPVTPPDTPAAAQPSLPAQDSLTRSGSERIDLAEDGRTLLALFGVAALVVAGMRVLA